MEMIATRDAYGKTLVELGNSNENVVVLEADLSKSTKTADFKDAFPERFFNFGIAEANMIDAAAGLSTCGKIPFASSFAIFITGRAWEQFRNTVGYPHLNVKLVGTHGGISVGADGASHQAIEDIAIMRAISGMVVMVPADGPETCRAVLAAAEYNGPVYIRCGRAKVPTITSDDKPFEIGKANILRKGSDVMICGTGSTVALALEAAQLLEAEGVEAEVINVHTIKPIDAQTLAEAAGRCGAAVTVEEHVLNGGLGSAIAEVLVAKMPVPVEMIGIDNMFGQSGTPEELFEAYGLTPKNIAARAKCAIGRK